MRLICKLEFVKTFRGFFLAALLVGSAAAFTQKTGEARPPRLPEGYAGILIAPPRYELVLAPDERVRKEFAILAKGYRRTITTEVAVMDWTENSEGGLVPLDPGSNPYSAASWIRVALDPLSLKPDEPISVPFEVVVPKEPLEGSYWAAITFTTKPAPVKNKRGVAVVNRLRIWGIVYVTIAGTEKPEAEIQNFAINKNTIVLDVVNKGNVYLRLHPELYFWDAKGEVVQSKKLPEKVLLREGLIRYLIPLKEAPKEAVVASVQVEAKGLISPLYAEVALR